MAAQAYQQKCTDFEIEPKQYIAQQLDKRESILNLSGNCVELFEDRIKDLDLFPLCDIIEKAQKYNVEYISQLNLSFNQLTHVACTSCLYNLILENTTLTSLDISGNSIDSRGVISLTEVLKKNNTLQSLNLSENPIGEEGGLALAELLKTNTSIKKLYLNNCDLGHKSITALCISLYEFQNLQVLHIARPLLFSKNEETTLHLAYMIRVNKSLRELNLNQHNIRDEALGTFLKYLHDNGTLHTLLLSGNEITTCGGEAIAEYLKFNRTLRVLDLSFNRLDTIGGKAIAVEGLKNNQTLQVLHVQNCSIGDEALFHLAQTLLVNPTLKQLKITNNRFEQASIKAWHKLLATNPKFEVDILTYILDGVYMTAHR